MNPEVLLSRIRIVLCRPNHPGNIGAAARAMKTMGLSDLHLVSPRQFPDPEADARASGAVDLLEQAKLHGDLPSALQGCVFSVAMSARKRELGPVAGDVRPLIQQLLQEAQLGSVALVFGNEAKGLSNEEIMHCQASVAIPTDPEFSSLNLGSAVQLMCYEARMTVFAGNLPPTDCGVTPFSSLPATHDEIEGMFQHWQRLMTQTGFFNPAAPGRLMPKLRRLFSRARLERDEVNILRGFLSSVEQPTGHGKKS